MAYESLYELLRSWLWVYDNVYSKRPSRQSRLLLNILNEKELRKELLTSLKEINIQREVIGSSVFQDIRKVSLLAERAKKESMKEIRNYLAGVMDYMTTDYLSNNSIHPN